MLFLMIEEKYCYIWTCHVENCSGFITILNQLHKLFTVMANVRFISRSESSLYSYTQE
jgi:hypothetical protein